MAGAVLELVLIFPFTIIAGLLGGAGAYKLGGNLGGILGLVLGAIAGWAIDYRLQTQIKGARPWVGGLLAATALAAVVAIAIWTR